MAELKAPPSPTVLNELSQALVAREIKRKYHPRTDAGWPSGSGSADGRFGDGIRDSATASCAAP